MALGTLQSGQEAEEDAAQVDEAAAAFGLLIEGPDEDGLRQADDFHLWPCNLQAFALFNAVQTQWRVGPAGPIGLDYPGVRASPAFMRIPEGDREDVFEGACVMERAYLAALSQRAPQRVK